LTTFTSTLFGGLLPAVDLTKVGKNWANQSKSALIYKDLRTFWLLIDWAQIITRRLFDINAWKAAFQLIGNMEHLRIRMNHWWLQFKNRLGPDG